tara:strand:+ start:1847 stop:2209 length:363 start_codon:yes stop_codon:yes gene_type:complete
MKINIDNSAGVICAVVVLIVSLCMIRYHLLQNEKFSEEGLFNNKQAREFERKFKFTNDCSPKAFKQKMLIYFKLVRNYKNQENEIYDLNDLMKKKYDIYQETMKELQNAKTDLDVCVNTN